MVRATVRAVDAFEIVAYGEIAEQFSVLRTGTVIVVTAVVSLNHWETGDGMKHERATFTAESVMPEKS